MNSPYTFTPLLHVIVTSTIALASFAFLAQPAAAAAAESCQQAMSPLQKRLSARYDAGPDALRDFIYSRRAIYQLDMMDVADRARRANTIDPNCGPDDVNAEPVNSEDVTSAAAVVVDEDGCHTFAQDIMRCVSARRSHLDDGARTVQWVSFQPSTSNAAGARGCG